MNTKSFFFLAFFILFSTAISSSLVNKKNIRTSEDQDHHELVAPTNDGPLKAGPISVPVDLSSNNHQNHNGKNIPDDDGKCHYFHFERLSALSKSRRILFFFVRLLTALILSFALAFNYTHCM